MYMSLQQITSDDIATWGSLDDVADTLEKRGLQPEPSLGEDHELVLRLTDDDEFMVLINAPPGETADTFKSRTNINTHTGLVATDNFEEFTFITRIRSWDAHGRTKHQQVSFTKEQMTSETGEKNTILQKLNAIEFNKPESIFDSLYDTQQVVKAFYEDFEELRTDLVQEVTGILDDRGDAKQRYVQVTLDRMIFLYFIQEKNLLDYNQKYLHEKHDHFAAEGDVYDEFYHPLFFEILAEGKKDGEFGTLPYLNGGLFSKNPIEEEFDEARLGDTSEETAELFKDILSFLSDWNWNVDERLDIVDPKNLSPAILGHIFEQTVNQKEMGAYYTPEEITGFMSRRTIHPWLLDQVNDKHGTEYEAIDEIFSLDMASVNGSEAPAVADGGVAQSMNLDAVDYDHVETLYFEGLKELRVLDPAVGSGAFLLAAQEVLIDIYLQCLEYFQTLREERSWDVTGRVDDVLDIIKKSDGTTTLYSKKQIILHNLYGVDIDDGAVEICKLRLWLSMVADIENEPTEVEPLPNIDFNIRQGNSLIGFTDIEEVATKDGDASLTNYGGGVGDSVKNMYTDIMTAVDRHRNASSASEAVTARRLAESRIEEHGKNLNKKVLEQFLEAGVDDISVGDIEDYSPFHWVLEFATVYCDGGFDVIIGNPPWDVLTANREDYFTKYDETFRTRMPDNKDEKMKELLDNENIAKGWETHQKEMKRRSNYFNNGGQYQLQNPEVGGRKVGSENDLSMLFLERVFKITQKEGYVAQILPGVIFNGAAAKDLRLNLLNNTTVNTLVGFENRGIFTQIDNRYNFGIITFQNNGSTNEIKGLFHQNSVDILTNLEEKSFVIPSQVLLDYSPGARIFPYVEFEEEINVLSKILRHPQLRKRIDNKWYTDPYRELDRSQDRDRFIEDQDLADYPVIGGRNIFQFNYDSEFLNDLEDPVLWSVDESKNPEKSAKRRIKEKNYRTLKRGLYDEFGGSGSQKSFVNQLLKKHGRGPLTEDDVLLDCTEYRIVYREIARPTDERTQIAAVIPPGYVCYHKLHTIRPYEIDAEEADLNNEPLHDVYSRVFTDDELFVAVGLLNSIPFDFLMRTKVDSSIVMYKFGESQLPRLTDGDDWFHYISERAAKLNCYGESFAEMRERLGGIKPATDEAERIELQAEIDAAAFHAYGLNESDTEFVLDDFHQVTNPRVMTEEYFELVFEKYTQLAKSGPLP